MLFSELKCKDVINVKSCKCLGRVNDLEFDECNGHIHALIICGKNKFNALFYNEPDVIIPYRDIVKIGPDIILVDIDRHDGHHH
ncbi:MAG: YlmC/YmxH family sporulation protein [Lachnospiraceae bacterium]|nr:YlmC/YmxH family sporulation protein [Lachnospiraceae bacterium]